MVPTRSSLWQWCLRGHLSMVSVCQNRAKQLLHCQVGSAHGLQCPRSRLLPIYPKTVQSNLSSRIIQFLTKLFMEKMSRLSNKTSDLNSLSDSPFRLIPVYHSRVSQATKKIHFSNCFLNSRPE